jgi:hydrogenase nickel incorporation protein HypA/HybF
MHEMGLAEGVLAVALEAADGEPIRTIRVRIGDRHAIVPESFAFCFGLAATGTVAAEAILDMEAVPVRLACRSCGAARDASAIPGACPACGGSDIEATGGEELTVAAIQLAGGEWLNAPDGDAMGAELVAGPDHRHAAPVGGS